MLNFISIFKNHLETESVSREMIRRFADDHLERLRQLDENEQFQFLIEELEEKLEEYRTALANYASNSAAKESGTETVSDVVVIFKNHVSRLAGLIKFHFIETPVYQEFFPKGASEYSAATKMNMPLLMERIGRAARKYTAILGSEIADNLDELRQRYEIALKIQTRYKGQVNADSTRINKTRLRLTTQLIRNMHYIAFTFPGDIDTCMDYFDQTFVRRRSPRTIDEGEIVTQTIAADTKVIAFSNFDNDDTFIVENQGSIALLFQVTDEPDSIRQEGISVDAGHKIIKTGFQLNSKGGKYLTVHNLNSTIEGRYSIERSP